MPVAVKDLIVTRGQVTTATSKILAGWVLKGLESLRREVHALKACVSTNSVTFVYSIVKDTPAYLLMTHITHAVTASMQLTAKGMLHFY